MPQNELNIAPKLGDTVRIVDALGNGAPAVHYASVIGISPAVESSFLGDNAPSLTVVYPISQDERKLSRSEWSEAFNRVANVRHMSHLEVAMGQVGICWYDVLPHPEFDSIMADFHDTRPTPNVTHAVAEVVDGVYRFSDAAIAQAVATEQGAAVYGTIGGVDEIVRVMPDGEVKPYRDTEGVVFNVARWQEALNKLALASSSV